jgi:predicted transposase YdaD
MSKPFDASTKYLVESNPRDWLALAGVQATAVEVIDADLSTVTAAADKLIRVTSPADWLVNLELQASYNRDAGEQLLDYSVLSYRRHQLPVQSIIVLLRREADGPEIDGYGAPPSAQRTLLPVV